MFNTTYALNPKFAQLLQSVEGSMRVVGDLSWVQLTVALRLLGVLQGRLEGAMIIILDYTGCGALGGSGCMLGMLAGVFRAAFECMCGVL